MDDDRPSDTWGKLVGKEFQDVLSYIEGESEESPGQKERDRRHDKRRKFGPEQQKWPKINKWGIYNQTLEKMHNVVDKGGR